MKTYTAEEVQAILRAKVQIHGLMKYAEKIGAVPSRLSESVSGVRPLSPSVIEAAGFEIRYVRKKA